MKTLIFKPIYFLLLGILFYNCNPKLIPPINEGKDNLTTKSARPKEVKDGKYPEVRPDFNRKLNEETKPYIVPDGPQRGKFRPNNKASKISKQEDSQNLKYEDFNDVKAPNLINGTLPEPSVAENGNTIMMTGNGWVSLSKDGGNTFNSISPTTVFPEDYGGFCCDQVLQYIPKADLFVWLLQYWTKDNVNAIRIAVQNTEGVRSSNGTSWTYWDFRNTDLASSGTLDYNDMSFGDNFLYWTSSIGGGNNRYVIRIPIKELIARSTINYQFTQATDAFWSHVTQNGNNGVYWAGHVNNSTLKVYSMMDNENSYSWRDVNINSWPNASMSSIAQNGSDWLTDASWKTYIRAASVNRDKIYFGWNASKSDNFPRPHVQIVELNKNNFTLSRQMQIWNPDFAFAYPYFDNNNQGKLGIITAFGGTNYNASSGVGVWGDFVIYYPRLSNTSRTNYGHYHTVRKSGSNGNQWVASGYTYDNNTVLPYYVRFSH